MWAPVWAPAHRMPPPGVESDSARHTLLNWDPAKGNSLLGVLLYPTMPSKLFRSTPCYFFPVIDHYYLGFFSKTYESQKWIDRSVVSIHLTMNVFLGCTSVHKEYGFWTFIGTVPVTDWMSNLSVKGSNFNFFAVAKTQGWCEFH